MNEVFRFHNIFFMGLLYEDVFSVVHIIPRVASGGHGFHDVFIRVEDGHTGGRNTT